MQIPFGTQSYRHSSLPLSAQRMVNCYLEPAPPHAKTLAAVVGSHGVASWGTAGIGPVRGAKLIRGVLYVVSGTSLYRVSSVGVGTSLGTIPGAGRVFIEGDETNVAVLVPATRGLYVWNGTTTAEASGFPGGVWLGYLDGYYLSFDPDSGVYRISGNRDPFTWNALDFASAEKMPDDLVTGIVDHSEGILFGTESAQGVYNSGNADFPLAAISNAELEIGCPYRFGPAKADNSVFFPANDGKIYRLNGWTPVVISTPAIEQAMARAQDRNFIGLTWSEPGHVFYALKSQDFAFVYDASTQLPYERESYGQDCWRWATVTRAYEKWIVGDEFSGALGYLSPDIATEFGSTMRALCTSPSVSRDNVRMTHHRLELVFEQGVGTLSGQGADPKVMLRWSDDGGRTWSNEHWRSLGVRGDFKARAVWNRLGQARDRVYEYSITDPVRRTLILATAEVELDAG